MTEISIKRTNSKNPSFIAMVEKLDAELKIRDGEDHDFYNQFNGIEAIENALVAYYKKSPIGCGALKLNDNNHLEVKRMYVLPEFRGKGIAGKLLMLLEVWALELGYTKLVLETGLKQPEAIALYKKNGYIQIKNYAPYIGVENSCCFEKKLS